MSPINALSPVPLLAPRRGAPPPAAQPAGGAAPQAAAATAAYGYPGYPTYPYYPYQPSLGNGLAQIGRGLWEVVSWTACVAMVPLRFVWEVAVGVVGLAWEALAAVGRGLRSIFDPGYGYHPGYPTYPTHPTYPHYPTHPYHLMSRRE